LSQTSIASARPELLVTVVVPVNGDRAEVALPVDACESLRLATRFASDQGQVSLVKPDGTVLPWAENTPGLLFQKDATPVEADGTGGGFVYHAIVPNPAVGNWKLLLRWPEPQWAGTGTLVYATWLGSKVEMNVFVPGSAFPQGTPVQATLALMENRVPRFEATITANLFRDGTRVGLVTFTLQTFPDLGAQSLIAELPATGPGHYILQIEATGQSSTGPFRRSALTDFDVYIPKGKILGTFTSAVQ
jgi:hypothetical protein